MKWPWFDKLYSKSVQAYLPDTWMILFISLGTHVLRKKTEGLHSVWFLFSSYVHISLKHKAKEMCLMAKLQGPKKSITDKRSITKKALTWIKTWGIQRKAETARGGIINKAQNSLE